MLLTEKNKIIKYTEIVIILLSAAFIFYRAPYGYSFYDEPFIVTLGQRLYKGDLLLSDEWHVTQMIAPVMLFFYQIFHIFSETNDGILLSFRYIYCVLHFLTCFTVYSVLRKKYRFAIIPFIYIILFSPYDYMSLSYKSIGLMCCLLIASLVYNGGIGKNRAGTAVAFSLLWCLLVMCCPYMAIAYILYLIAVFAAACKKKRSSEIFLEPSFALLSFGIVGIVSIVYLLLFVFREKTELNTIIQSIKYIFDDPEHQQTFFEKIKWLLFSMFFKCRFYSRCLIISLGLCLLKNKPRSLRLVIFGISAVGFCYAIIEIISSLTALTTYYEMIDIVMLGLVAFLLLKDKPWRMLLSFTNIGILYTVFQIVASNNGLFEFDLSVVPMGVSGIVFIFLFIEEILDEIKTESVPASGLKNNGNSIVRSTNRQKTIEKSLCFLCVILVLGLQLTAQLKVRMTRQFWDDLFPNLTETISVGAAKGLITTPENKKEYEKTYNISKTIKDSAEKGTNCKKFASFVLEPVIYLDVDMEFATFSAWTYQPKERDTMLKRFDQYYSLHPNCIPDVVFTDSITDLPEHIDIDRYSITKVDNNFLMVKH